MLEKLKLLLSYLSAKAATNKTPRINNKSSIKPKTSPAMAQPLPLSCPLLYSLGYALF